MQDWTTPTDDNSELEKTIEAESCEFSSSIEEFRRKEEHLEDAIQDEDNPTVDREPTPGQDVQTESVVGEPISGGLDVEKRMLSPEESEAKERKIEQQGEGEIKDKKFGGLAGRYKCQFFSKVWTFQMLDQFYEKCILGVVERIGGKK